MAYAILFVPCGEYLCKPRKPIGVSAYALFTYEEILNSYRVQEKDTSIALFSTKEKAEYIFTQDYWADKNIHTAYVKSDNVQYSFFKDKEYFEVVEIGETK